jgi:hypothetical protein
LGGANAVEYVLCEIQKKTHEHGAHMSVMRCSYRIEGGSVSPLKDRSDTDGEKSCWQNKSAVWLCPQTEKQQQTVRNKTKQ